MEDDRVWAFEDSLWTGDADNYREKMDADVIVVVPQPPYVLSGDEAVAAVADTPRWDEVGFTDERIARPQEGLIVVAYTVTASRGDEEYVAHCSSTYRRLEHEVWKVVQHQQTPPLTAGGAKD
ncbi:DUF4440 domain-containing protein [Sphingomonas sp. RS2018]